MRVCACSSKQQQQQFLCRGHGKFGKYTYMKFMCLCVESMCNVLLFRCLIQTFIIIIRLNPAVQCSNSYHSLLLNLLFSPLPLTLNRFLLYFVSVWFCSLLLFGCTSFSCSFSDILLQLYTSETISHRKLMMKTSEIWCMRFAIRHNNENAGEEKKPKTGWKQFSNPGIEWKWCNDFTRFMLLGVLGRSISCGSYIGRDITGDMKTNNNHNTNSNMLLFLLHFLLPLFIIVLA